MFFYMQEEQLFLQAFGIKPWSSRGQASTQMPLRLCFEVLENDIITIRNESLYPTQYINMHAIFLYVKLYIT